MLETSCINMTQSLTCSDLLNFCSLFKAFFFRPAKSKTRLGIRSCQFEALLISVMFKIYCIDTHLNVSGTFIISHVTNSKHSINRRLTREKGKALISQTSKRPKTSGFACATALQSTGIRQWSLMSSKLIKENYQLTHINYLIFLSFVAHQVGFIP